MKPQDRFTRWILTPGWVFILPSLVLLVILGLPIFAIFWKSIGVNFFTDAFAPTALAALRLSLMTSSLSTLLAVAAGMPLAYILARWKFHGKTVLELLVDLPVVLPPSVAGLALLIALFGPWGMASASSGSGGIAVAFLPYCAKAAALMALLSVIESAVAKLRMYLVPDFLGVATAVSALAVIFTMLVKR
jgi:ABC-type sulfate transport system permease component